MTAFTAAQRHATQHALKCELAGEVLRSSGYLRLQVSGWSMLPAVWPGDTLELERTARSELSAGDIVLFTRHRRLFAHRVTASSGNAIRTRGDAMSRPEPVVTEDQLLGRVSSIVRDGRRIPPRRNLTLSQRALAGVVRSSDFGARVIVAMRHFLQ